MVSKTLRLTLASIELVGQQVEPQPELEEQLVLPLLDQAARGDDQALLDVVAQQQLLDVEAGHDRLAGAGVVGEQEPQRRARQQLAVDRADLVRQRLHVAGGDGQHRVEQAGQRDPLGLGDQLEVGGGGVEGAAAGLGDAELVLVLAEDHLLAEAAGGGLVGQLERVGAVPLRAMTVITSAGMSPSIRSPGLSSSSSTLTS